MLPSGKALSPSDAANCTKDALRTAVFLRGVNAGIIEARRRFPGQRIEIVYAGTGPFAPLAIPLLTRYSPAEVRLTLIDVHASAIESARAIVMHLGFQDYVRAFITGDATAYEHPRGVPLHIVMAEAMQRALSVEPQVALTRNLVAQLEPGGILIPERIGVDFALGSVRVGRVAELTAAARLPHRTLRMPRPPVGCRAMYLTTIDVFGGHSLRENDSGLTQPQVLWDLLNVREDERIAFCYEASDRPGIRWTRRTPS